jgi:hypothetical protein
VILKALKRAEDGSALIFRLYEFERMETEAGLIRPEPAVPATEMDLMEKGEKPLGLSNGRELRFRSGTRNQNGEGGLAKLCWNDAATPGIAPGCVTSDLIAPRLSPPSAVPR